MLKRCHSAGYLSNRPTYIGCRVASEWLKFSSFRSWMDAQDWKGNHLDKDVLMPGNKVYAPEVCVFIPRVLNNFLNECGRARGEWPLGVYWNKPSRKFMAQCNNPFTGKQENLGLFDFPEAAHEAWRARKHEHAMRYADQQSDQRIAEALRARFAKRGEE